MATNELIALEAEARRRTIRRLRGHLSDSPLRRSDAGSHASPHMRQIASERMALRELRRPEVTR